MSNIIQFPNTKPMFQYRPQVQTRGLYNHSEVSMLKKQLKEAKQRLSDMAKSINQANSCYREAKMTIDLLIDDASRRLEYNLQRENMPEVTQQNKHAANTSAIDLIDALIYFNTTMENNNDTN